MEAFTFILAISTCVQVWAFIQSERASLAIVGTAISELQEGRPITISMVIQNGGRSTAYLTKGIANISMRQDNLPDGPRYIITGQPVVVDSILAGSTLRINFRPLADGKRIILGKEAISQIKDGTARLYVYGFIRFRDEFSVLGERQLGYCQIFDPENDPSFSFDSCSNENYTYSR